MVGGVEGASYGLQPRDVSSVLDGNGEFAASFANPGGNPVMHSNQVYAIYWDPTDSYHGDWQHLIDGFLRGMSLSSGALNDIFAVDTQYTDTTGKPASYSSTFKGAYTDTTAYPAAGCIDPAPLQPGDEITCLTDKQIREQLQAFIELHGLVKGMGTIYYLLTPPGVAVCLDAAATHCSDYTRSEEEEEKEEFETESFRKSFCSYHSAINPGGLPTGDGNTILYAMIPWTAGGFGDYHMGLVDQSKAGFECQDGGFDPTSKPVIEQHEKPKPKSEKEIEEFSKKTSEEKRKEIEAEHREGPHQEEPNQTPGGPGPDGSFDTGLADLVVNQIAVEQQNTVTNPLLNAWQDSAHNELTDECRNFFASGMTTGSVNANELTGAGTLSNQLLSGVGYYLNTAFDLAAIRLGYPGVPCLGGVNLQPQFTAPTTVNANEIVGFDGSESNITLDAALGYTPAGAPEANFATYTWSFGDGTPPVTGYAPGAPACSLPWLSPCAASVFHAYQYGGTYNVTLSVTDTGGNTASTSNPVIVVGPPPPGKESPSQSGPGSGPGSPGSGAPPVPAPAVADAVVSRTVREVAKHGLVVRYSVNEQVAGHFEVLLSRSLADRLGIRGTPAVGLPAGSEPELVIGKAFLVTTKGGRNTIDIQFSKRTARLIGRTHGVSLMLRLIVRNAAPTSPTTTTVISKFTLTR